MFGRWPAKIDGVLEPELSDQLPEAGQVGVIVEARGAGGELDVADHDQARMRVRPAHFGQGPDRGVLALPWRDLGNLGNHRSRTRRQLRADRGRGSIRARERLDVDRLEQHFARRPVALAAQALQDVVRAADQAAGGRVHERPDRLADTARRGDVVLVDDERRPAETPADGGHDPRAHRHRVHEVHAVTCRGAAQREAHLPELGDGDRRVAGIEPQASRRPAQWDVLRAERARGVGERPGRRGPQVAHVPLALPQQLERGRLRAAHDRGVVDDQDVHVSVARLGGPLAHPSRNQSKGIRA